MKIWQFPRKKFDIRDLRRIFILVHLKTIELLDFLFYLHTEKMLGLGQVLRMLLGWSYSSCSKTQKYLKIECSGGFVYIYITFDMKNWNSSTVVTWQLVLCFATLRQWDKLWGIVSNLYAWRWSIAWWIFQVSNQLDNYYICLYQYWIKALVSLMERNFG